MGVVRYTLKRLRRLVRPRRKRSVNPGSAYLRGSGPVARLLGQGSEHRLRRALRDALGIHIGRISVVSCEYDVLCRVETAAGEVSARILGLKGGTARVVEVAAILGRAGVRHAKVIHVDQSGEVYPQGFVVQEWIDGIAGSAALQSGAISEQELFAEAGRILRRIHEEPVRSFGPFFWCPPPDDQLSFPAYERFFDSSYRLRKLRSCQDLPTPVRERAMEVTGWLLDQVKADITPMLVHGDLRADNIVISGGEPVLIDWLNARGGCWIEDLAWTARQQSPLARNAFAEGYGASADDEFSRLLEAYHSIRLQLGLVQYFSRRRQRAECREILATLEAELAEWPIRGALWQSSS